jgi:hypothetical protein
MEESKPQSPKKIRLTRAEIYAMGISSPRQKRITFALIGLLIALALGIVMWLFQDLWLSYWLPEKESAPPAIAPAAAEPISIAPPPVSPAAEPQAPPTLGPELDFLSAAVWDDPQFLQGVRTFNRALDQHHLFLRDRTQSDLPVQIEEGAIQAAKIFAALRTDAPPTVHLVDYIARCHSLVVEIRNLVNPTQTPGIAPPQPVAVPAPAPRPAPPPPRPGESWQDPDYLEGARLFNQALEQYQLFQADKSHAELLAPIEDTAYQAAKKFEAVRNQAPTNVPVGDHISQCYKLIADCRRQNLESASPEIDKPRDRTPVGPSHRPALPAYQPPQ